jgi:gentisate 1,2-dioxygenase
MFQIFIQKEEKWMSLIPESPELTEFHLEVEKEDLQPLWLAIPKIIMGQPETDAVPYLWKWEALLKQIMRAGELVTPGRGGERRVLMLENPGLKAKGITGAATDNLSAAIQLIFPGEIAPSHRHSQTAIRFIMTGDRAYTTVQGEKIYMSEGDFILTPQWCWHDHGHEGNTPMIWMDGLDVPFVKKMNATFFEHHPNDVQDKGPHSNHSSRRYADGMLRPIADRKRKGYPSPLTSYAWEKTYRTLKSLEDLNEADPFDGIAVEFINPTNGESADYNIGSWMQLLRPNEHTRAHRHVHSAVYVVHNGSGYSIINGEKFEWSKGDFFVVPTWAWHEHVNTSDQEEALLFSINDLPLYEKLYLEAEEEYKDNNGYQNIEKVFSPERN